MKTLSTKLKNLLIKKTSRRSLLKGTLLGASALTSGCDSATKDKWDKFFQKHYLHLTESDKKKVFERIRQQTKKDYGVEPTIEDPKPLEGVKFAYALSLSRCNGNRRCVAACIKENNLGEEPPIQYIRVLEMPMGTFNLEKGNYSYDGTVPKKDKYYLPIQCHQCDNPPCTKVCPIEATWKEKDGIVVVDYDWCIGCRYCMAACPYEARRFNFVKPKVKNVNPEQAYLSNRLRPAGVVEKCHFCLHRTRKGLNPACLEACPTGARIFGNILDPESEISQVLKRKMVYILKEELNTIPSFFYFFD